MFSQTDAVFSRKNNSLNGAVKALAVCADREFLSFTISSKDLHNYLEAKETRTKGETHFISEVCQHSSVRACVKFVAQLILRQSAAVLSSEGELGR